MGRLSTDRSISRHRWALLLMAAALVCAWSPSVTARDYDGPWAEVRAGFELGFLAPLSHTIQFSKTGTEFDYVEEGGQDVLFPFARLTADLTMAGRHTLIFLYQPLNIETEVLLRRNIMVDDLLFPRGTSLDLRYGFDFWRLSYLYDLHGDPEQELAIGVSLQIRNANIVFSSDGEGMRRANRDVGPVPELKLRGRYTFPCRFWGEVEVDGMYAPVKYINGGDSDVEGAILDANLRAGFPIASSLDLFLNLRYLGGGADGTSEPEGWGDGYTSNWLHFFTTSVGFHFYPGAL